jgi:hypothetical protein
MEQNADLQLEMRLRKVEQRLRLLQTCCVLGAVVLAGAIYRASVVPYDSSSQTLRVRGLVIEDKAGHAGILIGSPVPSVAVGTRHDDATGLIVLGEDGADRLALAAPTPDPQEKGRVTKRSGGLAGLVVDDKEGNERGGFGVLDGDGRAIVGLDYPEDAGEAIHLAVIPGEGPALIIHDTKTLVRAALILRNDTAAELYGLSHRDKSTFDMGILKLNPYSARNMIIAAKDQSVFSALDSIKP